MTFFLYKYMGKNWVILSTQENFEDLVSRFYIKSCYHVFRVINFI